MREMKETKIPLKKLFNWNIITLQYCDGPHHYSCMMVYRPTWISLRYTCVPFIPNPLQLSSLPQPPCKFLQSAGFGCSASYTKLSLVIYFTYGNLYVSMLFSQSILPSPSPHWVQKSVLYVCVSFAVLHVGSSVPSF